MSEPYYKRRARQMIERDQLIMQVRAEHIELGLPIPKCAQLPEPMTSSEVLRLMFLIPLISYSMAYPIVKWLEGLH